MKKLLAIGLFLVSLPAFGQYRAFTGTVGGVTLTNQGFAQFTLTAGTAKTLASTPGAGVVIHPWARTATICVGTQAIRWKTSGTPTSSEGVPLAAGQCMAITNRSKLDAFTFIEQVSGAVVTVDYGW